MSASRMLNGVDLDGLGGTIAAVLADASLARFQFRAQNRWIDGALNRTQIQGYFGAGEEHVTRRVPFVYDNDEPPVLLGQDLGANPVEYLLHALAGCLTTSLVYHAANLGIEVYTIETFFEGDLDLRGFLGIDPTVRPGYQRLRVRFRVDAEGGSEVARHLLQIAKDRSPVFDMLNRGIDLDVGLERAARTSA